MKGFRTGKYGSSFSLGVFGFEDYSPIRDEMTKLGYDFRGEINYDGYCVHGVSLSFYSDASHMYKGVPVKGVFTTKRECLAFIKRLQKRHNGGSTCIG